MYLVILKVRIKYLFAIDTFKEVIGGCEFLMNRLASCEYKSGYRFRGM